MKNRFKLLVIIFFSIFIFEKSFSDELRFEASKIELLENQNIIQASEKIKIFLNNKTEINAEKFIFNKKKSIGTVEKNVKIIDSLNDLKIHTQKIEYNKKEEIIKSNFPTKVIYKNNYVLDLNNFIYDRKKSIITSNTPSFLKDNLGNEFSVNEFIFQISKDLLKSESLKYTDYENNKITLKNAIINFDDSSILGKDLVSWVIIIYIYNLLSSNYK